MKDKKKTDMIYIYCIRFTGLGTHEVWRINGKLPLIVVLCNSFYARNHWESNYPIEAREKEDLVHKFYRSNYNYCGGVEALANPGEYEFILNRKLGMVQLGFEFMKELN